MRKVEVYLGFLAEILQAKNCMPLKRKFLPCHLITKSLRSLLTVGLKRDLVFDKRLDCAEGLEDLGSVLTKHRYA